MSASRVSGGGNAAAAAAAAAARRAEEARRRAEAARRQAEQARRAAEAAKRAQTQAREKMQNARQDVVRRQGETDKAQGPDKARLQRSMEGLNKDAEAAKEEFRLATRKAKEASDTLQAAEVNVAREAGDAEKSITVANKVAGKQGRPAPFSRDDIAKAGLQPHEIKDAYTGIDGAKREQLAKTIGTAKTTDTRALQSELDADRDYAQLRASPDKARALEQLGIEDGRDLRGFGERLANQAEGRGTRGQDVDLSRVKDKEALGSILQASGNTLPEADKKKLADPVFARAVSDGMDVRKAANLQGTDLATEVYRQSVQPGPNDKAIKDWDAGDAKAFTDKLATQAEKYKNDPDAVRGLMTLSGPQLERSTQLLGDNARDKVGDKDDVKGLTANLSRLGNAAPEDASARLAYAVAREIPNSREQHSVDDGFGEFADQSGASGFRDMVAGALEAQDKGKGSRGLTEKGGGGVSGFLADRKDDVTNLARGARDAFSHIAKEAPGKAWDFVNKAADVVGDGIKGAGDTVGKVTDPINRLIPDPLKPALNMTPAGAVLGAADTLRSVGQTVKDGPETLKTLATVTQYRKAIDELGPNDTHTLHAGANAEVSGIRGAAEGNIAIRRDPDKDGKPQYTVSVDGQLGLGVGGKLGKGSEVEGSLMGNVGGKVELKFNSAEEAKHAVDAMMATAATAAVASSTGAAAPLTGAAAHQLTKRVFGADASDLADMKKNVSAITVQGNVAGELSGAVPGLKDLELSGNAKLQNAVRVEFKDGKPSAVVLQSTLSAGGSGTVSGDLGGTPGTAPQGANPGTDPKKGPLRGNLNANVNGSVTVEQRFTIPKDFELGDLASSKGREKLVRDSQAKVSFIGNADAGRATSLNAEVASAGIKDNTGVQLKASVEGNPAAILSSGAVGRMLRGDLNGALDRLGQVPVNPTQPTGDKGLKVDLSVNTYEKHVVEGKVSVEQGGNGGGGDLSVTTQDFRDKPVYTYSGDINKVRADVRRKVEQGQQHLEALRQVGLPLAASALPGAR